MNDVKEQEWHRWDIGLTHFKDSNFATVADDVDLSNIAEFYIGFGYVAGDRKRRQPPISSPTLHYQTKNPAIPAF
jgi:hypothetical protein